MSLIAALGSHSLRSLFFPPFHVKTETLSLSCSRNHKALTETPETPFNNSTSNKNLLRKLHIITYYELSLRTVGATVVEHEPYLTNQN